MHMLSRVTLQHVCMLHLESLLLFALFFICIIYYLHYLLFALYYFAWPCLHGHSLPHRVQSSSHDYLKMVHGSCSSCIHRAAALHAPCIRAVILLLLCHCPLSYLVKHASLHHSKWQEPKSKSCLHQKRRLPTVKCMKIMLQ